MVPERGREYGLDWLGGGGGKYWQMPLSGPSHNRLTPVIGDYLSCMLLCMCTYLLERAKEKKTMKTKQDKKACGLTTHRA